MPLKWLMRYDIRTDLYLKTTNVPVHIIHGTRDRLIPFNQSEALKALYPDKIHLHPIEDAHHNDLPQFPEFFELLYDILYVVPDDNKMNAT
jgi:pimeloyl-ACP methyl ester carboxylesterase